jgi:hypothetical protein
MGDIDPEYRNEVDKALRKNAGSNKIPDEVRKNSDVAVQKNDTCKNNFFKTCRLKATK